MSCEHALNFDQLKTFSENYKPMRVWSWLVCKFTETYCSLRLFSEFIQTQKMQPTSLDRIRNLTCHIKLKFFLWTKLLEELLLAKYLISVATALWSLNMPEHGRILLNVSEYAWPWINCSGATVLNMPHRLRYLTGIWICIRYYICQVFWIYRIIVVVTLLL